jgi:hypothetical protein
VAADGLRCLRHGIDAPVVRSSPRPQVPMRLSPPPFFVWFILYCHAFFASKCIAGL